ncbi:hypothetical protein IFM46972_08159 [Aspergillus udagawae]|uniref:Uncharacterized protein n=1 Tax=Aspergillus udagawae TaxID=91492 RepID=A0A8H3S1Y6_9EURO|nr:hypothetical protein IFM46972_08159 [Aspergillus udagawae]
MASQTPPILSMQEAYLVPYGAIGFASDIVTLYMVTCLLFGRAPLCPARRIRNIRSAKFLIGFWIFNIYMTNKYNVEQCWQYWELVLINVSNGVMGALVALVGFFMVGSWDPPVKGEAKENDPESSPALGAVSLSAPEEEAAMPDERICDSARKYGTMADMPSSGLNRISRISRLSLSNTQGQSNSTCDMCPQMSEVTRELNSMANEPAQPVDKVKFGYLAVLGVYIGAVLIGSIPLTRLAVLEGKGPELQVGAADYGQKCLISSVMVRAERETRPGPGKAAQTALAGSKGCKGLAASRWWYRGWRSSAIRINGKNNSLTRRTRGTEGQEE